MKILLCAVLLGALNAAEAVIVEKSSTLTELTTDNLKAIFLGRTSTWGDGSTLIVVVAGPGASTTALLDLLGKSPSQFAITWKKLVFTGKGVMPTTLANDAAVVEFVAGHPGAIGFVEEGAVGNGVKRLAVK